MMSEKKAVTVGKHGQGGLLAGKEAKELEKAWEILERQNLAIKLTNLIGDSIQQGANRLPQNWRALLSRYTEKALLATMNKVILPTMNPAYAGKSSNLLHKTLASLSGTVGGALGFAAIPFELPISTAIFTRSIMDVARGEGFDLKNEKTLLNCLEVFALGGGGQSAGERKKRSNPKGTAEEDEILNENYYVVRMQLAKYVSGAMGYLAATKVTKASTQKAAQLMTAPAIVQLLTKVSARYSIVVTQKTMSQLVPVVGGVAGGLINYCFIDYFQNIAWAHFRILKLEEEHGEETIRIAYGAIGERNRK